MAEDVGFFGLGIKGLWSEKMGFLVLFVFALSCLFVPCLVGFGFAFFGCTSSLQEVHFCCITEHINLVVDLFLGGESGLSWYTQG